MLFTFVLSSIRQACFSDMSNTDISAFLTLNDDILGDTNNVEVLKS